MENQGKPDELKCAKARVLREVLKTPAFREIIKIHTAAPDPQNAEEFARTLLRQDINFSLGMLATLPDHINSTCAAINEVGKQLEDFPPELLAEFSKDITSRIQWQRFSELSSTWLPLLSKMADENPQFKAEALQALSSGAGRSVRKLNEHLSKKPSVTADFFRSIGPGNLLRFFYLLLRGFFSALFFAKK